MPTTTMKSAAIDTAGERIPADASVYMLNLLRYHAAAEYADNADRPPCSGREAYFQRYVPAFGEVAADLGLAIEPVWIGQVLSALVMPADEAWDDVAIVAYPNYAAFRQVVESDDYRRNADPHRVAALADWRLIATAKMDLPG